MDGHISMASKNILNEVHSKSIKSKTLAPIFTNKIILDSNKKSIDELKLYETQISFKNLDVKEEILENIGENDNDESLNKNFKEKLAKMNILSNPIKPQPMIKFVEAVKMTEMNSFDKINTKKAKDQNKLESDINNHQYRHLIFAPYCTESTFKKHLTLTYRGLVYSKKCLKGPSESFIKSKQVNLIESKGYF